MAKKKKVYRDGGIRHDQKLKSYLVLKWMQRNTDKNHPLNADGIADEVVGAYGISAERRSIYRDIDAINAAVLLAHGDADSYDEALELVDSGDKTIIYDASRKGYYYNDVYTDFEDVRLAAECVYAAKFIDKERADRIIKEIICKDVSEFVEKDILNDIFVSDRVRTTNKHLYRAIGEISEAMRHRTDDDEDDKSKYKHKPEKISFQYLTHTLGDVENEIEKRCGAEYVVSPYKLMVCDGNYYLLAYNSSANHNKVRTYRVDRMRNVKRIKDSAREGWDEVKKIELKTYTKTHFNMFNGDSELVTIRFTNDLLDAVYDRFGSKNVRYLPCDDNHFTITTRINLSQPFYGWLFSFGNRAKILQPQRAVDEMKNAIAMLSEIYEQD